MATVTALTRVLLPGLDGTGELFERFVAMTPPGCDAQCMALPDDRPRSYRELAAWVGGRLPEGPVALIAESFSGPLAVLLAAEHPRVEALVLCATFVTPPLPGALAHAPSVIWERPPPEALLSVLLTGGDRELARSIRAAVARVSGALIASRVRQALRVNVTEALARVTCPVLVLSAKRDHIMRPRAHIASKLRVTRLVELDAPHLLLQTRPAEAWTHIESFLASLRGGAAQNSSSVDE